MPEKRTIYYVPDGGTPHEMAAIDARQALQEHGDEWDATPAGAHRRAQQSYDRADKPAAA